jgi:hypothetical protein
MDFPDMPFAYFNRSLDREPGTPVTPEEHIIPKTICF